MMTIWKYELEIVDTQAVEMPMNAKIISAQSQSGVLILWAEVDTESILGTRTIRIFGTGNPADLLNCRYIDTVQMGALVWHVYETAGSRR